MFLERPILSFALGFVGRQVYYAYVRRFSYAALMLSLFSNTPYPSVFYMSAFMVSKSCSHICSEIYITSHFYRIFKGILADMMPEYQRLKYSGWKYGT